MHPYKELEGTRLWATLDKTVSDLVGNQDLQETTPREYIVGFLAQRLAEDGLLSPEALRPAPDDANEERGTNPDAVYAFYAERGVRLSVSMLDGGEEDDLVLVEGDRVSLEFLGELIRAQAGFRADCGTSLSPRGAGRAFFAERSRFGLYVHRAHPEDEAG